MKPRSPYTFPRRLIRLSIAHPWRTLLLWGLAVLVGSPHLSEIRFETTARSFLDRTGPRWAAYEASIDRFGSDEMVAIAIEGPAPYDPATLAKVAEISRRAERLTGVRRVDSLSTVPVVRGTPDGTLHLDPPLPREPEVGPELSEDVERRLRSDRVAENLLVSPDGRTLAVNVYLDTHNGADRARVVQDLRALVEGQTAWISGVPVFETRVGMRTRSELSHFVPMALGLLMLLLGLCTRSLMGMMVPLLASGIPCILLLQLMGALDLPFTMTSMLLPTVLLALGCAYVMHLLVAGRGVTDPMELEVAIMAVARPTVLSGVTTALGFVAIAMAPIDAIRQLGLLGATGVLCAMAAALTLAPALLRLVPRPEHKAAWDPWIERYLAPRILDLVWRGRRGIVAVWVVVLLVFGWGALRLHVETDAVHWFPPGSEIRNDYDSIRAHLSGISPINVMIEPMTPSASAASPEALARIAALADYLDQQPEVGRTLSIADPVRQLHGGFIDDPSQPLPDDGQLIGQYLLLLDSVEHIDDLITPDQRSANVLVRMNHNGSAGLLRVARKAEDWWAEHGTPDLRATATGIMFEFSRSEEAITHGQLVGLGLALLAIGLMMVGVLRASRTALVALVPNAIPLIIVFGFLGLAGIPLDAAIVCLGSLSLGIAVDDTTHIVLRHQDAVRQGVDPRRALAEAFRAVLPAVVLSTLAVSVGFAVLALSEFTLTRNLGLVTVSLVSACLIADATLLPALLLPSPRTVASRKRDESEAGDRATDPCLPPLLVYDPQAVSEVQDPAEKEESDESDEAEADWMAAAVDMNPGFDLSRVSRAEQIGLSMLDPRTSYSLAIECSVLRDPEEAHRRERVHTVHRLLLPFAILESWRVMFKILVYRLFHIRWIWSTRIEDRTRFLLGPRRIMSSVVDGSSPLIYALRHGVTTSAALDVLYNCTNAAPAFSGLRGALAWFWCHEPHAQGVRNRVKMVYWKLLEAMRAERSSGRPVRVLSLACGSAHAVIEAVADFLEEDPEADVTVELVDLDVPSLRRAERLAQARGVASRIILRCQNIRAFLAEDTRTWPIVEMVGFLDYRADRSLVETCSRIRDRLEPGGIFLTATVCPSAWASIVRWLANWPFLVRRSRAKFQRLLRSSGYRSELDHYVTEATGTFLLAYLYRAE